MYPLRPAENLQFQVKQTFKNHWQKWLEPVNGEPKGHYDKKDVYTQGYEKKYVFDLVDGKQIELSGGQWSQCLLTAFDAKKHWKDCVYIVKTNGKTGKDIRYWFNLVNKTVDNLNVQSTEEINELGF